MESLDDFLIAVVPYVLLALIAAIVVSIVLLGVNCVSETSKDRTAVHVLKSLDDGDAQIEVVEINGNNYVIVAIHRGVAIVPETKTLAEGR